MTDPLSALRVCVAVLRELERSASECEFCAFMQANGHAEDCRLMLALRDAEAELAADITTREDEPRPGGGSRYAYDPNAPPSRSAVRLAALERVAAAALTMRRIETHGAFDAEIDRAEAEIQYALAELDASGDP